MNNLNPTDISLEAKIAHLSQTENYPDPTTSVQCIDTHMSCVFITDLFVYKMKKPIKLPFLDFSSLASRKHFCAESLRLNRRLAAQVYLDVVPLTADSEHRLCIDGNGIAVEWLEKMQRLPDDLMLDKAIAEQRVSPADVRRFARVLTDFYARSEPVEMTAEKYIARVESAIQLNHRELRDKTFKLDITTLDRAISAQHSFVQKQVHLSTRVDSGKIIEAHGDLRPEHVCLSDPPVFIDCLEFDRSLRLLDKADELAFLAMECEYAGAAFIGPILFSVYRQTSGDDVSDQLLYFYMSVRALLRARLCAWHIRDHSKEQHPHWLSKADRYLMLAGHYAQHLDYAH